MDVAVGKHDAAVILRAEGNNSDRRSQRIEERLPKRRSAAVMRDDDDVRGKITVQQPSNSRSMDVANGGVDGAGFGTPISNTRVNQFVHPTYGRYLRFLRPTNTLARANSMF